MSHFERKEFACKCGCGFDTIDIELLPLCELVRSWNGAPVIVDSGCRCPEHNAEIGGSTGSLHKKARAADLKVADPEKIYKLLCASYPDKFGFGVYDTFVHVDTRTGYPARWRG